jgi:hypothetical protein
MLLITRSSTTADNHGRSENRSTSARLSNQNGSRFKKEKTGNILGWGS